MLGSVGQFVEEVALYWMAYEITGSAMALGVLGLCSATPRLILGAFSGVLVDRYDRKLLLILVQFGCALPISIFLAIYTFGTLAFWHLLVLEILFGSIRAINPSAAQSILGELVPREDIMNAVSLYTVGFNIARIAGPSLGGILIILIGVGGCYGAYLVTLLISGTGMLFIRTRKEESIKREGNFVREFKEGFHYVWHAPVILSSIVAAYTFAVFVVTYQSFLPVFAKEILQVGPRGLGMLMAAPGLGGIASLSFLAAVGERWSRPVHEGAEAARLVDDVGPRLQVEVVGVGQDGLGTKVFHGLGQHRLDGGLGADGDERRRVDVTVRRVHDARPAGAALELGFNLEELRRRPGHRVACRNRTTASARSSPASS